MSILRYAAFFLTALASAGCQFSPSPTKKAVTTNDVLGVWSFTEDYGKTTVLMTFVPSGIFTQEVVSATQTNIQTGKWSLDGPYLNLDGFLAQTDGAWKPDSMMWYFIDGYDRPLEIFGGAFPDSDAYQHLKYISALR